MTVDTSDGWIVNKEALYTEGKRPGGEYGKPDIGSNLDTFASTPAELAAGEGY